MSSVDQLFDRYTQAFEAGEKPAAVEYLNRLEGQERAVLERRIEAYLDEVVPIRAYDPQRLEAERNTAWAQAAREIIAEPSAEDVVELYLRLARQQKGMTAKEIGERVLIVGGVTNPTPEEKEHAAEYIGRLESGELLRVAGRAWKALAAALEVNLTVPAAARPSHRMAFRMEPSPPASPGTEPADSPKAEIFLHAWSIPSRKKWDRVDEFFLEDDE